MNPVHAYRWNTEQHGDALVCQAAWAACAVPVGTPLIDCLACRKILAGEGHARALKEHERVEARLREDLIRRGITTAQEKHHP